MVKDKERGTFVMKSKGNVSNDQLTYLPPHPLSRRSNFCPSIYVTLLFTVVTLEKFPIFKIYILSVVLKLKFISNKSF